MGITPSFYDTAGTLRGLAFLALSDTGYILRGSVVDNLGGGGTLTFGTAGTVACRVDPMGGGESRIADAISDRTTHLITTPALTDISASDNFVVSGITFEITAIRARTDEQLRVLEAVQASSQ